MNATAMPIAATITRIDTQTERAFTPRVVPPISSDPQQCGAHRQSLLSIRVTGSANLINISARVRNPEPLAATLAQAIIEVMLGQRPYTQLHSRMTRPVYEGIVKRTKLIQRIHGRPRHRQPIRILSVRTQVHRDQRGRLRDCEASVTLHDGTRTRAVALQLIPRQQDWVLTALEIG